MFGRALTSVFWGVVADRYGRKPVILLGTAAVVVFNPLFGLSTSFWMAISMRFLQGCFNGLLGPIKAYASEVCRKEHQSLSLSLICTSWGVGLIIGPAIGGFLAQETLHMNHPQQASSCNSDLKSSNKETEMKESNAGTSLFKNWPLMFSILVYCAFSLHDMAYTEVFSLWAVSDREYGGLSYSTEDAGTVLSVSGFGLLLFQLLLYPECDRLLGPVKLARVAALLLIPVLSSYPFIAKLSGLVLSLLINSASIIKNVLSVTVITGTFILQNKAVPQHQRGTANGLAMTVQSLFKAFGPAGEEHCLLGHKNIKKLLSFQVTVIFFMLNLVELIAVLLTFKPFLVEPSE